ncbi:MAG: hypothetical protein HY791_18140 [Deltaproteobacteria bacterium]|nr:hypothetical protein [Deltaproteobacteria bacterium]
MTSEPIASPIAGLLARAAEVVPGPDANRRFSELREQTLAAHGFVALLEFVLPETDPWRDLIGRVVPRLARLVGDRGHPFPGAPFMIVPLWYGTSAYVFVANELFVHIAELEGITLDVLEARARGPRLALGPGST